MMYLDENHSHLIVMYMNILPMGRSSGCHEGLLNSSLPSVFPACRRDSYSEIPQNGEALLFCPIGDWKLVVVSFELRKYSARVPFMSLLCPDNFLSFSVKRIKYSMGAPDLGMLEIGLTVRCFGIPENVGPSFGRIVFPTFRTPVSYHCHSA